VSKDSGRPNSSSRESALEPPRAGGGRPSKARMRIALSVSDDLADLLNRSRRVTVPNGVPSARASGLDMSVMVVKEDDLMRLNAQPFLGKFEDRRVVPTARSSGSR